MRLPFVPAGDIYCYQCAGDARNSSCADPFLPQFDDDVTYPIIHCYSGACVKFIQVNRATGKFERLLIKSSRSCFIIDTLTQYLRWLEIP